MYKEDHADTAYICEIFRVTLHFKVADSRKNIYSLLFSRRLFFFFFFTKVRCSYQCVFALYHFNELHSLIHSPLCVLLTISQRKILQTKWANATNLFHPLPKITSCCKQMSSEGAVKVRLLSPRLASLCRWEKVCSVRGDVMRLMLSGSVKVGCSLSLKGIRTIDVEDVQTSHITLWYL